MNVNEPEKLNNDEKTKELVFTKMSLDAMRERLFSRARRGEDINQILAELKQIEEKTVELLKHAYNNAKEIDETEPRVNR